MNTAVVNFKTDAKIKRGAQAVARDLGFSLSSLLNAYLRNLVRTRTVAFGDDAQLELTPWAKRMLRQSEKDTKAGFVSPTFSNADDAIAWLHDPRRPYQNGHTD